MSAELSENTLRVTDGSEMDKPLATKLCNACRSEMPFDANLCKECNSVQDWRRYLTFSSTVLALLVSLVSVLTFSIPIWVHTFVVPKPLPQVSFIRVVEETLTVAISNSGSAPFVISSLEVPEDKSDVDFQRRLMFRSSDLVDQKEVIRPGEIRVIKFQPVMNDNDSVLVSYQELDDAVGMQNGRYCGLALDFILANGSFGEREVKLSEPVCRVILDNYLEVFALELIRRNLKPDRQSHTTIYRDLEKMLKTASKSHKAINPSG